MEGEGKAVSQSSRPWQSLTPEEQEEALDRCQDAIGAMPMNAVNWNQMAREAGGVHPDVLRRRLDAEWAAEERERARRRGRKRPPPAGVYVQSRVKLEADAAARLAEIPDDTRSITGRMFGDPLPQRSALGRSL